MPGVRSAECDAMRTRMFHGVAVSRSNISLELTLAPAVVIIQRRVGLRAIQFGRSAASGGTDILKV